MSARVKIHFRSHICTSVIFIIILSFSDLFCLISKAWLKPISLIIIIKGKWWNTWNSEYIFKDLYFVYVFLTTPLNTWQASPFPHPLNFHCYLHYNHYKVIKKYNDNTMSKWKVFSKITEKSKHERKVYLIFYFFRY